MVGITRIWWKNFIDKNVENRRTGESQSHESQALILGCPGSRKLGSMVRISGLFHLLINGVYWGYNPFTNHLLTSWDIQVGV